MSIAEPETAEDWPASYIASAVVGWMAGYCAAVLVGLTMVVSDFQKPDLWLVLELLPVAFAVALIAGILVGGPTAVLGIVMMAAAERMTAKARTLPAWLAGGLLASIPLAWVMWLGMQGPADHLPPVRALFVDSAIFMGIVLISSAAAWTFRYRIGRI